MSAFMEVSPPDGAVHGKIMPGGKVEPEGFQMLLDTIVPALLRATPAPFVTRQLAEDDLLGDAVVFHAATCSTQRRRLERIIVSMAVDSGVGSVDGTLPGLTYLLSLYNIKRSTFLPSLDIS